jgi:hypothetical protein
MTGESSIFSLPLIPVTQSVSLVDGSTSHISHKGDVCLSSDIMLSSVLYIPNFALIFYLLVVLLKVSIVLSYSYPFIVCFRI